MAALDPVTFISYSREDAVFALRLAQDLKAAGARVWLDQLDIVPGHEWDSAVEEALVNSPRMLLILSPASSKSGNVRNEIHFAMNYGKIIIPVLYQPCVAPLALQRIQHVDFTGNYERALGILTTQLKTMPPKQAVAPLAEPEPEVALEPPQKPIAAPAIENPAGARNSTHNSSQLQRSLRHRSQRPSRFHRTCSRHRNRFTSSRCRRRLRPMQPKAA